MAALKKEVIFAFKFFKKTVDTNRRFNGSFVVFQHPDVSETQLQVMYGMVRDKLRQHYTDQIRMVGLSNNEFAFCREFLNRRTH